MQKVGMKIRFKIFFDNLSVFIKTIKLNNFNTKFNRFLIKNTLPNKIQKLQLKSNET